MSDCLARLALARFGVEVEDTPAEAAVRLLPPRCLPTAAQPGVRTNPTGTLDTGRSPVRNPDFGRAQRCCGTACQPSAGRPAPETNPVNGDHFPEGSRNRCVCELNVLVLFSDGRPACEGFALPAAARSTAHVPWAVANRPARSAWLRRRHRKCAAWRSSANACGLARTRSLPRPAAGVCVQRYRRWYPAPRRSGCRSMHPRRPRRPPSAGYARAATAAPVLALGNRYVEPLAFRVAEAHNVFLDGALFRGHGSISGCAKPSI